MNSINLATEDTTDDTVLRRLHEYMRRKQYDLVQLLHTSQGNRNILWEPTSYGWTALHVCCGQGIPNGNWWRTILDLALSEISHSQQPQQQQQHQRHITQSPDAKTSALNLPLSMDDRTILTSISLQEELCKKQTQALTTCSLQAGANENVTGNDEDTAMKTDMDSKSSCMDTLPTESRFVSTRTNMGYSCVDFFFRRQLHPSSRHRQHVREKAQSLRDAIAAVLSNKELQSRARDRISDLQREERSLKQARDDSEISDLIKLLHRQAQIYVDRRVRVVAQFWHSMELLLMAACLGTIDYSQVHFDFDDKDQNSSKPTWRVVHALAFTNCPPEVANLALALYPQQAMESDENGNLPLHIASASPCFVVEDQDDTENASGSPILVALTQLAPQAAHCVNRQGRLPINIALSCEKTWNAGGVRHLLKAFPDVLDGWDNATHLPCFLLAALPRKSCEAALVRRASRECGGMWRFLPPVSKVQFRKDAQIWMDTLQVNTIFELLRAAPDAVASGVSDTN